MRSKYTYVIAAVLLSSLNHQQEFKVSKNSKIVFDKGVLDLLSSVCVVALRQHVVSTAYVQLVSNNKMFWS